MTGTARVMIVALACALCGTAVAAGNAQRNDPFVKPVLRAPEPEIPDVLLLDEPAADSLPELRAILHSPQGAMVNLNGELVRLGGRFGSYRVAAVAERDVVLLAGDQTAVISLDEGVAVDFAAR